MTRAWIGTALVFVAAAVLAPVAAGAQSMQGMGEPGMGRSPGGRSVPSSPPAKPVAAPPAVRQPMAPPSPVVSPSIPVAPVAQVAPPAPQGFPAAPPGFPGAPPSTRQPLDRHRDRAPFHGGGGIVYATPPLYYGAPGGMEYGWAPPYEPAYDPSLGYGISGARPAAPATPSVIEYPTGRYELRGDGTSTPYTWVWIPNPPPAPPAAEPAAPRAPGPVARPPASEPAREQRPVYRWTDRDGIVHFTDSLDAVPPEYRSQIKPRPSS